MVLDPVGWILDLVQMGQAQILFQLSSHDINEILKIVRTIKSYCEVLLDHFELEKPKSPEEEGFLEKMKSKIEEFSEDVGEFESFLVEKSNDFVTNIEDKTKELIKKVEESTINAFNYSADVANDIATEIEDSFTRKADSANDIVTDLENLSNELVTRLEDFSIKLVDKIDDLFNSIINKKSDFDNSSLDENNIEIQKAILSIKENLGKLEEASYGLSERVNVFRTSQNSNEKINNDNILQTKQSTISEFFLTQRNQILNQSHEVRLDEIKNRLQLIESAIISLSNAQTTKESISEEINKTVNIAVPPAISGIIENVKGESEEKILYDMEQWAGAILENNVKIVSQIVWHLDNLKTFFEKRAMTFDQIYNKLLKRIEGEARAEGLIK
jgi:hypothetical protein